MSNKNTSKIQSLSYLGKSTRATSNNQRSPNNPTKLINKEGDKAPILQKEAESTEGDSEFMAKLSEITGKLSSMDYVPKNKLLKKEYEKPSGIEADYQSRTLKVDNQERKIPDNDPKP